MGLADFYLNIYIDESLSLCVNEKLNSYDEYNLFNYIKSQNEISIECYFDNFLITNKILFSVLSSFNDKGKIKLEAMKSVTEFNFQSELELFNWLYKIYEYKMDDYFKDLGFLSIPAKNYYKRRNKYRKYYKKLKY